MKVVRHGKKGSYSELKRHRRLDATNRDVKWGANSGNCKRKSTNQG